MKMKSLRADRTMHFVACSRQFALCTVLAGAVLLACALPTAAAESTAFPQLKQAGVSRGGNSDEGTGIHDTIQFTPRVLVALLLACVCALLANAAGIGGGPIYLPLLMVVLGFELTPATALSHTIVATSAVASSIYGLIATSPNDPSRSLIDWDLTIFIPALLIGVSIGVLFNVLFPSWLQTVLLTALLLLVINNTAKKGLKMWRSEQKDLALKQRLDEDSIDHEHTDTDSDTEGVMHEEAYHIKPHRVTRTASLQRLALRREVLQEGGEAGDAARQPLIPPAVQEEAGRKATAAKAAVHGCLGRQPVLKIGAVLLLWVVFLVFQQVKSRHDRCSAVYLTLFAAELLLLIAFTGLGIAYISAQSKRHPDEVDPELREVLLQSGGNSSGAQKNPVRRLVVVAAVMAFSGSLAGLLGIGARALIFNPFLLALGVHPQVTASTSVLMILFSSSAISLSLSFQGYLNTSYAAVFAPLAFVSSIIGVTLIGKLIKKTGHTSIIVFILTALICVGTVLTAVFGGINAYNQWQEGEPMGLAPFCGTK